MTRNARVVMVVRLFHPWVGGTERQAHKLARELVRRGHPVGIVTGRWFRGTPAREVIDDVPVTRHSTLWECFGIRGLRKFGGYLYMFTLAWHLYRTRHRYDIIHIHGLNYHTAVAALMGRLLGKPTLVKLANSGMASDIDRTRSGRQLAGSRLLLPAALTCDRFVALSPTIVGELLAAGVGSERIVSIPNGVEVQEIERRLPDPGHVRLVFVGRLHPQKGVDVLLEACRLMSANGSEGWSLRIVGDGPQRRSLEELTQRYGLASSVEFVGEVSDPVPEMDAADVFVLPSRTEGMSNALLEAMARGKAVVATAVSGSLAIVEDAENGILVPADDPAALQAALERLIADREKIERLGWKARESIQVGYSLEKVAASYVDLYSTLLADTGLEDAISKGVA